MSRTCQQCGRQFEGSTWFCCEGCANAYNDRKKRLEEERKQKRLAKRNGGGGGSSNGADAAAATGAAIAGAGVAVAGVAAAGAKIGVAAIKGYGKLLKWTLIIGLPLCLLAIGIISLRDVVTSKGAGGIAKTQQYVIPESKINTKVLYVDLIFTDEANEVIDSQVANAKEQVATYKNIDSDEKFPKSRSFVQERLKDYHTKFLNNFGSLDDITFIDGVTVDKGIAQIGLKNNEWNDLDKVCALAKLIDADCILYAMPSSIDYRYANSAQGPYVEEKFKFSINLVNPETQERQKEILDFTGLTAFETLFPKGGADGTGKDIKTYFDFNEYYNYALSKKYSGIIENSGKWDLQEVKQSKVKYPNKKYPACPYGTQKWKLLEGKKKTQFTEISSLSFESEKVIVTYEDGSTKEGEYKYSKANPTTTSIKIKGKEVEKYKSDYRLGSNAGIYVSSYPLYFYDAKIGELTIKVDGKNIISKAPVYSNSEDEFAMLLKYTKDSSGNAVFMYFEK